MTIIDEMVAGADREFRRLQEVMVWYGDPTPHRPVPITATKYGLPVIREVAVNYEIFTASDGGK